MNFTTDMITSPEFKPNCVSSWQLWELTRRNWSARPYVIPFNSAPTTPCARLLRQRLSGRLRHKPRYHQADGVDATHDQRRPRDTAERGDNLAGDDREDPGNQA